MNDPDIWDDPAYHHQVKGRRLGEFNNSTIAVAMGDAQGACECCGKKENLQAHHILPLGIAKKYFSHIAPTYLAHFANCRILCRNCHNKEHSKPREMQYYESIAQGLIMAIMSNTQEVYKTHRRRY